MYVVTVRFEIKPGAMERFMPLMQENARASVADEVGCIQFDICRDPENANAVFLYEKYTSRAAFELHMQTPHFHAFNTAAGDMIADKTIATYAEVWP